MKKAVGFIMILLVGVFLMAIPAQAQTVCWQLAPYIDKIEVGYEAHGGHYVLHGKWVAGTSYFMPVVGDVSSDAPGSFNMGLHATNNTIAFGGFKNGVLDAQLSSSTLNGTWILDFGAGSFTNSGTLTNIPCPIAASEESGPVAGSRAQK